jgi:hypothetical protein
MKPKLRIEPGDRFGRLVVLEETRLPPRRGRRTGERAALCTCDCGGQKTVRLDRLFRQQQPRSCGCTQREQAAEQQRTHGLHGHLLYPTWRGMLARCYNEANPDYPNYGGRGISVCPRWHDVAAFIEDIEYILGPRPEGKTLDRIRNGLGYKPSNVRWATWPEQARNQRRSKLSEIDVREIHRLWLTGEWTKTALAAKYSVTRTSVFLIVSGKNWKELRDE